MLAHLGRAVVAADHEFGEGLVVAQQHVEARLQLLDEVGFQQQGVGLGRAVMTSSIDRVWRPPSGRCAGCGNGLARTGRCASSGDLALPT
jgi:hypothetical protein